MLFPNTISLPKFTLPSIAEREPEKFHNDPSFRLISTHASSEMNIDPFSTRASSEMDIYHLSDEDSDAIEAEIICKANKKISKRHVLSVYQRTYPLASKGNCKGVRTTYLQFTCLKCAKPYLRGTGTDSGSTGAMHEHVAACWGEDVWNEAKNFDLAPAKDVIKKFKTMKNVKLTEMFAWTPSSKETYSLSPLSREAIQYVLTQLSGHF